MSIGTPKMMLRAAAYGAYGGDRIGVLHHATKISLTTSVSGVPTLRLTHTEEPNPALEEENEIAVEASLDGGRSWFEPAGGRFLIRKATWNLLSDGTKSRTIDCVHISARLKQALVWEENFKLRRDYDKPGQGVSTTDIPADLFIQVWQAARNRGWGAGLSYEGAAAADANGNSWSKFPNVKGMEVKWSSTLWQLMETFQKIGALLPRWEGRKLLLVPPARKPLESLHPKRWPAGRSTGGTNSLSWADIATRIHVLGKDGKRYTVNVPTDENFNPRDTRELSLEANWVDSQNTAEYAAQEALVERSAPKEEIVRDWSADKPGCLIPWQDYNVGDWFWVESAAGKDQWLRVTSIQIDYAEGHCSGSTIFGTRIADGQTRLAQYIAANQTGTAHTSTSERVRSRSTNPAAQRPGVIAADTVSVMGRVDETGTGLATWTTISWPAPKYTSDGAPLTAKIREYEVRIARVVNYEKTGLKDWAQTAVLSTSANSVAWADAVPGERYLFWVRAITEEYAEGDWDTEKPPPVLLLEWQMPPVPTPFKPKMSSQFGVASVGLDDRTLEELKPPKWWVDKWQFSLVPASSTEPPSGWAVMGTFSREIRQTQYQLQTGVKYALRVRYVAFNGKTGGWSPPNIQTVNSAINLDELAKKISGSQELLEGAKAAIDQELQATREAQGRLAGATWGGQFPPDEGTPGESLWLDPFGDVYRMKSHY